MHSHLIATHEYRVRVMTKSRSQMLSEKAHAERRRCRDWLLPFMQANQPKFLTKDELRSAAMRELEASKLSFDIGWIMAIEDTGRHDWYEPLRWRIKSSALFPTFGRLMYAHAHCTRLATEKTQ